jgi:hypothetical protein
MEPDAARENAVRPYAVTFVPELPEWVPAVRVFPKNFKLRLWCVRGGQGDHPIDIAILRHGGQAASAREAYLALSATNKSRLRAFLRSL